MDHGGQGESNHRLPKKDQDESYLTSDWKG